MTLILPGHPLFDFTLDTAIRPDWRASRDTTTGGVFLVKGEDGLMRPATEKELDEYLYGGEYEEVYEDDDECELLE